ncbi:MAG: hypothetical protein N2745_05230 [Syntrophorhabdaceae bacterium]|nr:hypothetical protein [Syntrophorhabdaceae bacterium]
MDLKYLNGLPLNKKARDILKKLGVEVDEQTLYAIQLARWGYEKGGLDVDSSVSETVEAMFDWRPVRIMNFFMIDLSGEGLSPPRWEDTDDPVELARIILDDIQDKILHHFPWIGSI